MSEDDMYQRDDDHAGIVLIIIVITRTESIQLFAAFWIISFAWPLICVSETCDWPFFQGDAKNLPFRPNM